MRTTVRNLFIVLMTLAVTFTAWAESINEGQARSIASRFMARHAMPASGLKLARKAPSLNATTDKAAYYVFNGAGSGYVIVAGDDRAPAVLGYSDKGTFDDRDVPEALQELLEGYAAQIEAIGQGAEAAPQLKAGHAITPLVKANWSQNNPYNILLPYVSSGKHAVVGCVATAMAQVMYYHKWPARPTMPIPAYTTETLSISMPELPVTDFEWDLMQDTYQTYDTLSAAALAAARLSLYCAQSVEMNFKTSSSGASTSRVPMALSTYFGYTPAAHAVSRGNYSSQEWADLLYSEIAAGRPVIFSASKASGGHAFICDGYDGNGLFHFNWGWNGSSNGYFLLNVLNPDIQGTGSASGTYGYIYRQAAIVGLEPDNGGQNEIALTASDVALNDFIATRYYNSDSFTAYVSGHFNNYTSEVLAIRFGWGLYQGETMISKLYSSYSTGLVPGNYFNHQSKELTFGSNITSGTYRIVPICAEYGTDNWRPCIGSDRNYIEVTITGNTCSFTGYGTAGNKDYTINSITPHGTMHPNRPIDIDVNLTNNGLSSNLLLHMFVNGTFASTGYVSLEPGETGDIPFRFMPEATGDYTLTWSWNEDGSDPIATRVYTITAMPAANLSGTLNVLNVIDGNTINSDKFSVDVTVTNDGTQAYHEDISIKFFKHIYDNYGTSVQGYNQYIELEPGASTTLHFEMDNAVDGWKYFARAYYYTEGTQTKLVSSGYYTIVHPEQPQIILGDVNGDNEVTIKDVTMLIDYLLSGDDTGINLQAADCNQDNEVTIKDVTMLIDYLLSGTW